MTDFHDYEGLEPAAAFELCLRRSMADRRGTPAERPAAPAPEQAGPRVPRPDPSQGVAHIDPRPDPMAVMADLVNRPRRGDGGWRDINDLHNTY